jgi:hypothetical protein
MSQSRTGMTAEDLRRETHQMIDQMLGLIADYNDDDVTFVPVDPEANDRFAANEADIKLSWTLGHVIVHTTASAEEAAFIAAELARGVPHREGRSRYEIPWQSVTTIVQCRSRLEESRRMRLASLDVWPNPPHLDNTFKHPRYPDPINAVARFEMGLRHDESHLEQIRKIVAQAKQARSS